MLLMRGTAQVTLRVQVPEKGICPEQYLRFLKIEILHALYYGTLHPEGHGSSDVPVFAL